jgi:hypothetical protein
MEKNRRQIILDYIRRNDRCTKQKVINYMNGTAGGEKSEVHAALMTTVKIIDELIKEKFVILKTDPKNSQMCNLYFNHRKEFNLINSSLTEIEDLIIMMEKPMDDMRKLRGVEFYLGRKEFFELRNHLEFPYRHSFEKILLQFLIRINNKIHSQDELQFLYTRIYQLMKRLNEQTFDMADLATEKEILESQAHLLEKLSGLSSVQTYAKEYSINIKVGENLVKGIRNFEERFLN